MAGSIDVLSQLTAADFIDADACTEGVAEAIAKYNLDRGSYSVPALLRLVPGEAARIRRAARLDGCDGYGYGYGGDGDGGGGYGYGAGGGYGDADGYGYGDGGDCFNKGGL